MSARLSPGDPAPDFTLPDADGKQVSLADYRGRRVIVYFYPAAMTPGCTKEACDFRDNLASLDGAGIDVVGISPDKPEKLAKFREAQQLTFPLLADPSRSVCDDRGRVHGYQALHVADASVIPSNLGVNPQHTIMALARYFANRMLDA